MNMMVQAPGTARVKLDLWRHNRRLAPAKASLVWKQPCSVRNTWLMMWQLHQVQAKQAKHAKHAKHNLPAASFDHLACAALCLHRFCTLSGCVYCCASQLDEKHLAKTAAAAVTACASW